MIAPRRRHEPLPLEARRALWERIWDRLLAPTTEEQPHSREPTRDGRPTDPFVTPDEERSS
jgi:hypothetical protein